MQMYFFGRLHDKVLIPDHKDLLYLNILVPVFEHICTCITNMEVCL